MHRLIGRRTRRCFPARQREGRRGGLPTGQGRKCARSWKFEPGGRQGSGVSGCHAARCKPCANGTSASGAAREAAALPVGVPVVVPGDLLRSPWASRPRSGIKWWLLNVLGYCRSRARSPLSLRCGAGLEPGHLLRHAPAIDRGRALGSGRHLGCRGCRLFRLARPGRGDRIFSCRIGLLVGGAVGDAIDRIAYGAVSTLFTSIGESGAGTFSTSPTPPSLPGWPAFCMTPGGRGATHPGRTGPEAPF